MGVAMPWTRKGLEPLRARVLSLPGVAQSLHLVGAPQLLVVLVPLRCRDGLV